MSAVTVKTQAELDAALAANEPTIYIDSPRRVWLRINDSGSSSVVAWGSSSVEAWDSSSVVAWDSSSVVAWGSSSVVALGSSSVVALGSSSVEARDSSSVEAWDSSSVVALGSSSVEAWGSSSVEAWPYVAVRLHSVTATVNGGVVIDIAALDLSDPAVWCDMHLGDTEDGHAVVFKAVDDQLRSGRGMVYPIGETVEAPDWKPTAACGAGLHFGPTPRHARDYNLDATRYLACRINLTEAVGITDGGTPKIKARSCEVLYEVDLKGRRVETAVAA